jgi:hypothetical protein
MTSTSQQVEDLEERVVERLAGSPGSYVQGDMGEPKHRTAACGGRADADGGEWWYINRLSDMQRRKQRLRLASYKGAVCLVNNSRQQSIL